MSTESKVTQADFDRATEETNRLCRELDITNADHIALWIEHNTIPDEPMNQCASWLACRIVEAHEAAHRTAAQPEREAVLEDAVKQALLQVEKYAEFFCEEDFDPLVDQLRAALTTPVPAVKPHCSTCGKDVAEVLCETCGKWWAENLPAPAVSTDEIVAALFKSQSFSTGHGPVGEFVTLNFPNRADREAFLEAYIAALKSKPAILSRIRGEQ